MSTCLQVSAASERLTVVDATHELVSGRRELLTQLFRVLARTSHCSSLTQLFQEPAKDILLSKTHTAVSRTSKDISCSSLTQLFRVLARTCHCPRLTQLFQEPARTSYCPRLTQLFQELAKTSHCPSLTKLFQEPARTSYCPRLTQLFQLELARTSPSPSLTQLFRVLAWTSRCPRLIQLFREPARTSHCPSLTKLFQEPARTSHCPRLTKLFQKLARTSHCQRLTKLLRVLARTSHCPLLLVPKSEDQKGPKSASVKERRKSSVMKQQVYYLPTCFLQAPSAFVSFMNEAGLSHEKSHAMSSTVTRPIQEKVTFVTPVRTSHILSSTGTKRWR
ncbi:adhesive plaque matrix protein [Elysia marginata]|uniref:Adhesive plaque matrix protein n=1 Tax=Elysia marginata TaxID=1093978 RepID=A0AAV4IF77_9GAST|nr:adhesive plaque matrix protein [Elysia marginata]